LTAVDGFGHGEPDIFLAARSFKARMTRTAAIELAFLCGAVEADPQVTFEVMTDTRFIGKKNDTLVIRKHFGKWTHYVLPLWQQAELMAWQKKLNEGTDP